MSNGLLFPRIMKIINKIEEFLTKLGVGFESVEKKESELNDTSRYVILTEEAALLIGNKGETLASISHILRKLIDKDLNEEEKSEKYFVDIGEYQNKRIQEIKSRAIILAERARFFKKDVEMPPMGLYERLIVHSTFTDYPDLETESTGRGPERRVVIKYKKEGQGF